MVILDKPYISAFLQNTLEELQTPVLERNGLSGLLSNSRLNIMKESQFLNLAKTCRPLLLYCNSENSLDWINEKLADTGIPEKIRSAKDKVLFRKLISSLYPEFSFTEINYEQLDMFKSESIKKPFIIKPSIGFLSLGVYKVFSDNEWPGIVSQIKNEMQNSEKLFPKEVVNASKFIIEEYIDGEEFAVDAYYNSCGSPVILNILKHPFISQTDVGDRLYYTSKKIIQKYKDNFESVLKSIGDICGFVNFPVHIELRVSGNNAVIPVEINPMRFAGWCTADISYYAYGINVYKAFLMQEKPDWQGVLENKGDAAYAIIIADTPRDIDLNSIIDIDYDRFKSYFNNVLELRKIDFNRYPIFSFAFVKADGGFNELKGILEKDFHECIKVI